MFASPIHSHRPGSDLELDFFFFQGDEIFKNVFAFWVKLGLPEVLWITSKIIINLIIIIIIMVKI